MGTVPFVPRALVSLRRERRREPCPVLYFRRHGFRRCCTEGAIECAQGDVHKGTVLLCRSNGFAQGSPAGCSGPALLHGRRFECTNF